MSRWITEMNLSISEIAAWTGVGISALSIVVAIIALIRSSKAHRETIAIQKKVMEIEQEREADRIKKSKSAVLHAEIRNTGRREHRLFVINSGESAARNVTVKTDNKNARIPDLIGPKTEVSCMLMLDLNNPISFEIEITWDDDYANNKKYETKLTYT